MMNAQQILSLILPMTLAGCLTIHEAHETQARLDSRGAEDGSSRVVRACVDWQAMSLADLVSFAQTNRPEMVSAALEVADARLALREIAADAPIISATPWNAATLGVSASYAEASQSATFSDLSHTEKGSPSAALSLDLLIWDFGRNDARVKAQTERILAAEQSLADQGYTVFATVTEGYFALEKARALMTVARTNVCEYADHLSQVETRFEAGEAIELDVLKSKLDLARAEESVIAASNEVLVATANLLAALGLEASNYSLPTRPEDLMRDLSKSIEGLLATTESAAEAASFAMTNAPAMRVARARLRAASADVDYAIANLNPTLSASLSLNWTDPLWYWRWGVSAAQNLFSGFARTTAVKRAVVALERAEADLSLSEQQLSADLAKAVAERDNAREACATAETVLARAKDNLDQVKEQYEVGEASRIEFTDAVGDFAEAQASLIEAICCGQIAEAQLTCLMGRAPTYL